MLKALHARLVTSEMFIIITIYDEVVCVIHRTRLEKVNDGLKQFVLLHRMHISNENTVLITYKENVRLHIKISMPEERFKLIGFFMHRWDEFVSHLKA